jgi:hypothetical protein
MRLSKVPLVSSSTYWVYPIFIYPTILFTLSREMRPMCQSGTHCFHALTKCSIALSVCVCVRIYCPKFCSYKDEDEWEETEAVQELWLCMSPAQLPELFCQVKEAAAAQEASTFFCCFCVKKYGSNGGEKLSRRPRCCLFKFRAINSGLRRMKTCTKQDSKKCCYLPSQSWGALEFF